MEGQSSDAVPHGSWGLVVSRCSDREEVVFGTMMLGRPQGSRGRGSDHGDVLEHAAIAIVGSCPELSVA